MSYRYANHNFYIMVIQLYFEVWFYVQTTVCFASVGSSGFLVKLMLFDRIYLGVKFSV